MTLSSKKTNSQSLSVDLDAAFTPSKLRNYGFFLAWHSAKSVASVKITASGAEWKDEATGDGVHQEDKLNPLPDECFDEVSRSRLVNT